MKRVLSTVLLVVFIGSLVLFAACDGGANPPGSDPTVKAENPGTTFELDAWSGALNHTKSIKFDDYFDANGVTGITYEVTSSDTAKVRATRSGTTATLTGEAAGSATVTLGAKVSNEVKASVTLNITVVDTTPARYPVTGLGEVKDGDSVLYTVLGDEEAVERSPYNFQIATDAQVGTPVVKYKVGDAAEKTLDNGVENPINTFTFSIPVEEVIAPVTIGTVSGLSARSTFSVAKDSAIVEDGYTLTFAATAQERKDFALKAVLDLGYYPGEGAGLQYKVAEGDKALSEIEAKTVAGTRVGNEVTFTIPATQVTGNLTIMGYTGLVQLTSHNITGLVDGTGYTIKGEATCIENYAYYFTVQVDTAYMVADKLEASFEVEGKTAETIEGVLIDSFNQIYEFYIYRQTISNDTAILSIAGITEDTGTFKTVAITTTEKDGKSEFTLNASPKAYTNEDYTFSVDVPSYYEENAVVEATCTVGGEAVELTQSEAVTEGMFTNYSFTLPKDDLGDAIVIDVEIEVGEIQRIKNFPEAYYQAGSWADLNAGQGANNDIAGQAKPTDVDGTLKFTDTIIRREGGASGTTPNGTAVSTDWEQVSFEVKSAGIIDMTFFATSNMRVVKDSVTGEYKWGSGDNWLRLYTDDKGILYLTSCQATVNTTAGTLSGALGSVDVQGRYKTEFMRVDILYRTLAAGNDATTGIDAARNPGRLEVRLFIDGEWVELQPSVEQEWSRLVDGNLITSIRRPNYGNRAGVFARGGEEGSIYVRNVALPEVEAPAAE